MRAPDRTLSSFDAIAIIIGVVIGAGIFKTPSLVAVHAGSIRAVVLFWILGGIISLVGALCYAELTTAYPDAGGDYHYLRRAFGNRPAFLFAWARMTVIQAGSIAMLAFILGDYASSALGTGTASSWRYAVLVVAALTLLNAAGIRQGARVQNVMAVLIVGGLLFVVIAGLLLTVPGIPAASGPAAPGKAMVFVLLTYGGWNEAAYISAELKRPNRNMIRVLLISIAMITALYVTVNIVFLKGLGLQGTARSETVAADLMRIIMGEGGARFISALIVLAAVSTMNAVIITGARTNYALGRDFPFLGALGKWRTRSNSPVNALLAQGAIAILLVGFGALTRGGFTTMVEYTAPVFWFFFLLVGIALFVLRRKDPGRERPFRVPFYPVTPTLFCLFCLYMFQASLGYAGAGAAAGLGVLLAGVPVMELALRSKARLSGAKAGQPDQS